jgi:lipoprotein-anchoring transpeptidase ErfK/SrfK
VEQPGQGNSDPANHKPALPVKAPAVPATRPNGEQAPAQAAASGESAFDLAAIDRMIEAGDDVAAHRELSKQYWNHPETRSAIQSRIDKTARSIYFAPLPHYMDPYVIQPGDQLRTIAKQYSVPWEYLAKLNQLDPRRIRSGQKLKVLKGPFSAVVDLGAFELTVHAHGYYVRRYLVGIGEDGRSPVGRFTVLNKVVDPQYTDPNGRVIASDDPNNPLGERWIDIGDGFGIHGTIDPESIGKAESRGCVRMHNSDVEELFDLLEIGSEVLIRR